MVKRRGWEGDLRLLLRSSEPYRLRLASDLLPLELEAVHSVELRRRNPGLAGDAFTVDPDFFASGIKLALGSSIVVSFFDVAPKLSFTVALPGTN